MTEQGLAWCRIWSFSRVSLKKLMTHSRLHPARFCWYSCISETDWKIPSPQAVSISSPHRHHTPPNTPCICHQIPLEYGRGYPSLHATALGSAEHSHAISGAFCSWSRQCVVSPLTVYVSIRKVLPCLQNSAPCKATSGWNGRKCHKGWMLSGHLIPSPDPPLADASQNVSLVEANVHHGENDKVLKALSDLFWTHRSFRHDPATQSGMTMPLHPHACCRPHNFHRVS